MTSRLRNAFRFQTDDFDGDGVNSEETLVPLDVQEQEELINSLRVHNDASNKLFVWLFLFVLLTLAALSFYICVVLSYHWWSLCSVISYLTSAILLAVQHTRAAEKFGGWEPYVWLASSAFSGIILVGGRRIEDVFPGVVLAIVYVAKSLTHEVDVGELEKLRYNYLGA
ncbi:MAG: hypothetical protein M1829_000583 [Trizodia sp. TS-e1964]|nr:MAG: hypothetical protein M1829_000583 [Trizodia sp. TS-e1964]